MCLNSGSAKEPTHGYWRPIISGGSEPKPGLDGPLRHTVLSFANGTGDERN